MTGANGGADPGARPERQWDVALSFAGAQRDYVGQVAEALKARGVRCFYDADEQIELWGKYLADELPAIYGEQAAAVVMFVSAEYAAREWTRLERQAALARAVRERREYVLPARFDDTPLPGLPSDMVTVDLRTRTPQQFAAMIADKLAALAASAAPADAGGPPGAARPAGAVRVSEADPRRLGVHAAISVPGVPDEVLPEYVPRDADAAESGIRAKVAAAAERGGFVLLVGGSSVGKTRCAVEAVKALLPDWWLVHPAGPAEVAALAAAPPPRTVVWLDELQRYLDGEHGLTGGVVRALLDAPYPAVIIGTLWPDRYTAYTAVPAPGGADPHAREREVLDLAAVIRIGPEFSPAEQDRARAAAARDPRLRVALEAAGYGLTQTLAAAPQLVARWEDAQTADPYAWAVLTAALDAARLGARAPLSAELPARRRAGLLHQPAAGRGAGELVRAGPGLCHRQAARRRRRPQPRRSRHGPGRRVHRRGLPAPARQPGTPLCPRARQHLGRRPQPHPRSRRCRPARGQRQEPAAVPLRHPAVPSRRRRRRRGCRRAAGRPAGRARRPGRGRTDTARPGRRRRRDCRPAAGRPAGRARRPGRAARPGRRRRRACRRAAGRPAGRARRPGRAARPGRRRRRGCRRAGQLLAEHGDLDELRARANAGDEDAALRLADLLAERGDLDEAVQILQARPADAGDGHAAGRLADLLAERGDLDEAAQLGAERRRPGCRLAAGRPAGRARRPGRAARPSRRRRRGCRDAAGRPAGRARRPGRGSTDTAGPGRRRRRGRPPGSWPTCWPSAATWRGCGPGPMPATGLPPAAGRSAGRARRPGRAARPGRCRRRALPPSGWPTCWPSAATWTGCAPGPTPATGTPPARLADVLIKQGRGEEAERLRRFGLNPDGSIACA